MTQEILYISFLLGTKKDEFNLNVSSHFCTEVGGLPWINTYHLVVDDKFHEFWRYVRSRYSVDSLESISEPTSAKIEQKNPGVDVKGYPWTSSLVVEGNFQTETTIFYPYCLGLLGDTNDDL